MYTQSLIGHFISCKKIWDCLLNTKSIDWYVSKSGCKNYSTMCSILIHITYYILQMMARWHVTLRCLLFHECVCSCWNWNCSLSGIGLHHGRALYWKIFCNRIFRNSIKLNWTLQTDRVAISRGIRNKRTRTQTIRQNAISLALIYSGQRWTSIFCFLSILRLDKFRDNFFSIFMWKKNARNTRSTGNLLIKSRKTTEYIFNLRFWLRTTSLLNFWMECKWNTSSFHFSIFIFLRLLCHSAQPIVPIAPNQYQLNESYKKKLNFSFCLRSVLFRPVSSNRSIVWGGIFSLSLVHRSLHANTTGWQVETYPN